VPSPSLSLYLLAARRASTRPVSSLSARPEADPLIWIHVDPGSSLQGLGQLAHRMQGLRPDLGFLVTAPGRAPPLAHFPQGSAAETLPPDRLPDLRAFLDHFRPALILLTGPELPPALIHVADGAGIPVALADLELAPSDPAPWRWSAGMAAALLRRIGPILLADAATARVLARVAGPGLPATVTGRIEATFDPPGHDEDERLILAELIGARPVWLAADLPEAEEEAVIAAHAWALRFAHRALLILAPADPDRATAIAARLSARGLEVARRSAEEDPEEDVQVLIADLPDEIGLWYRLAPVAFLGGTLTGKGPRRPPAEAAGLGSAILHGPRFGAEREVLADLDAAGAACKVVDAAGLAEALADILTPERAAELAFRAWQHATTGAEVRERAMQLLFERLDGKGGAE